MANWSYGSQEIAEVTGVNVTGTPMAGGAQIQLEVALQVAAWPAEKRGSLTVVPQPSEVIAKTSRGDLGLGLAIPTPNDVAHPVGRSWSARMRFRLALTTHALAALEAARDGAEPTFSMTLVAYPLTVKQEQGQPPGIDLGPMSLTYSFAVPRDRWAELLKKIGYCDTLVTELPLPPATSDAGGHLARGVAARNEGRYSDAIAACRIALERLDGAPKEASGELERIVKARRADLSERDRFVLLRSATHIFASPVHHGATHHEREDADLAIAMTAALLRLAPRWGAGPTETGEAKDSAP